MFKSIEGAEDDRAAGEVAVDTRELGPSDIAMGIAAGGSTPFVLGALARAKARGARAIFLTCAQPSPLDPDVDLIIRALTGPEVLTGSTRLKAGTATKLILNQITTLAMARQGKVYENLMVDLRATNAKLKDRAIRNVATLTGIDRDAAMGLLESAGWHVKTAVVMQKRNVGREEAARLLAENQQSLRRAISA